MLQNTTALSLHPTTQYNYTRKALHLLLDIVSFHQLFNLTKGFWYKIHFRSIFLEDGKGKER